jgi:hypothetical protein
MPCRPDSRTCPYYLKAKSEHVGEERTNALLLACCIQEGARSPEVCGMAFGDIGERRAGVSERRRVDASLHSAMNSTRSAMDAAKTSASPGAFSLRPLSISIAPWPLPCATAQRPA